MSEAKIELSVEPTVVTVMYFIINYHINGPAGEWYQLWKRTIPKDDDFVDFVGWDVHKHGNFSVNGTAASMIMLERTIFNGHKVQLLVLGENDEFSNMIEIEPLEAGEEDPPEPPAFKCPYEPCTERFDTLDELKAHIDEAHLPQEGDIELLDKVDKVAVALGYDSNIDPIAIRFGLSQDQMIGRAQAKDFDAFITKMPVLGQTPKAVYDKAGLEAISANLKYAGMVSAASIAEALPFVDVGQTTLHFMNAPQWGAGNRMASDYYYSPYRYVTDPFIRRYLNSIYHPYIPEPYRLALAASRGILTDEKYTGAMGEQGYDKEWADMWRLQNHEYPNFAMITQLYWRDVIDEVSYKMLMQLAGYHPEIIDELQELTKVIPPLTDLITMAVREAFGDHTYKEQMPALVEWGAKQGLSAEWVDRYWYSHWDRIPLTQMYANLWRDYWTPEEFDRMLRIKDVHPDDRKAIMDVAFNPPSIREMGYGYDFGRYGREDIVRYRKWGGLNEEDAQKAADALIDYRTSAEWEAIRREFLWRFAHELDTEEEYRIFLEWTGLQPYVIDLWVYRGLAQQDRFKVPETAVEYRIVTSSEALWAFKNGLKEEAWLRKALFDLGWTDERTNLAVERATYEKAAKEDVPDIIKPKTLTISQLKSLYNASLITIEVLTERLQSELNYTKADAAMLAKTYITPPLEPEPPVKPRKLTLSLLKQMYELQVIDGAQLVVELVDSLNYDINDAYAIVELYTPKFEPEVTVLEEKVIFRKPYTDSWSRRLYAQRLFIPLQVYSNYLALGYDPTQAEKLTISSLIDDIYPTITAQYKKAVINEEQFLNELIKIGMSGTQAIELLERTVRDFQTDRLDDERKLTKSEIMKGYKNNILTAEQTAELLVDIGYEYWEAQYIIMLQVMVTAGDPESYWDMKRLTEAYKRALNRDNKPVPPEIIMLDKELTKAKDKLKLLEETMADENETAEQIALISQIEARIKKVMVLKGLHK